MSLVGYRARNHPQQVRARGTLATVDDRAITLEDFAPLHERFKFTIDAAATRANARLERYWTPGDDALSRSWAGERVWCNPPHSNVAAWVAKAWRESAADLVVMLTPANRTEQHWWQEHVEPYRDREAGLHVEFLPGRMRFLAPGQAEIGPNERPPYGRCLLIWQQIRRRGARGAADVSAGHCT